MTLIRMAPVSVLVSEPVWLYTAPRWFFGCRQLCADVRACEGFPPGVPHQWDEKGLVQKCDTWRDSGLTISSYIPVFLFPVQLHVEQEDAGPGGIKGQKNRQSTCLWVCTLKVTPAQARVDDASMALWEQGCGVYGSHMVTLFFHNSILKATSLCFSTCPLMRLLVCRVTGVEAARE